MGYRTAFWAIARATSATIEIRGTQASANKRRRWGDAERRIAPVSPDQPLMRTTKVTRDSRTMARPANSTSRPTGVSGGAGAGSPRLPAIRRWVGIDEGPDHVTGPAEEWRDSFPTVRSTSGMTSSHDRVAVAIEALVRADQRP